VGKNGKDKRNYAILRKKILKLRLKRYNNINNSYRAIEFEV
jgi:hypothetical protein